MQLVHHKNCMNLLSFQVTANVFVVDVLIVYGEYELKIFL
jgi:hypothetical protein